jgi:uncharacterized protein (TIGR00269 family)
VKCARCDAPPVIELRARRMALCAGCFAAHCRDQVRKAVDRHQMIRPGERVLVAVSGGKDSLAAWDLLTELGHHADGMYLGLGIGGYSDRSAEAARAFAAGRGLHLIEVDLAADVGFSIPQAAGTRRVPCSACGLSKRHLLNKIAVERGYQVLATGHNLDDEAAVLFGNVLTWDLPYLARQQPVLPQAPGFARRVKPLTGLTERETAAYCVVRRIGYVVEECPMAAGNRHLAYKELLNTLEERSPGTKAAFLSGFTQRLAPLLADVAARERAAVHPCARCGSPTLAEVCAFCRLADQAGRAGRRHGRRRRRRRRVQPAAGSSPSAG